MPYFEKHVFVCTNERDADDKRGCCTSKGGKDVHLAFRSQLKERNLKGAMRVNKAGCLDCCAKGVTVVVYPDNIWYGGVTAEDVEEIVNEHLIAGTPVERLRLPRLGEKK